MNITKKQFLLSVKKRNISNNMDLAIVALKKSRISPHSYHKENIHAAYLLKLGQGSSGPYYMSFDRSNLGLYLKKGVEIYPSESFVAKYAIDILKHITIMPKKHFIIDGTNEPSLKFKNE